MSIDNSNPISSPVKLSPAQRRELESIALPERSVEPIYNYKGFTKNTILSLLDKGLIRDWQFGDPAWKSFLITPAGRAALAPEPNAPNIKPLTKIQQALLKIMADGRYLYRQELAGIPNDLWMDVTEHGKMYGDHFVVRPLINAGYLYEERTDEEGSRWAWKCTIGDGPQPAPERAAAPLTEIERDLLICLTYKTIDWRVANYHFKPESWKALNALFDKILVCLEDDQYTITDAGFAALGSASKGGAR